MPTRCAPALSSSTSRRTSSTRASGTSAASGEHAQVIASGPARVEVVGFEHGADRSAGSRQLDVGLPEDERVAAGRLGEAEQDPQRRGLAGAVGSEEPGHRPGLAARTRRRRRRACRRSAWSAHGTRRPRSTAAPDEVGGPGGEHEGSEGDEVRGHGRPRYGCQLRQRNTRRRIIGLHVSWRRIPPRRMPRAAAAGRLGARAAAPLTAPGRRRDRRSRCSRPRSAWRRADLPIAAR